VFGLELREEFDGKLTTACDDPMLTIRLRSPESFSPEDTAS